MAPLSDVFTVDSLLRNSEVTVPSGERCEATINDGKNVCGCLPSGTSGGFADEGDKTACDGDLKGCLCTDSLQSGKASMHVTSRRYGGNVQDLLYTHDLIRLFSSCIGSALLISLLTVN